jgi:Carbamoyltransferase C-terminus
VRRIGLDEHQVDLGWPEVAGIDDTSLHQTALAVLALARLRHALAGLGPDLTLPGGVSTNQLLERTGPLAAHGLTGLLYHRRASGAWGWRTYASTVPSPSKTALCLMAVAAAAPLLPGRAGVVETGGAGGQVQARTLPEVVAEAAGWLVRNHHRWETFVEDDKDVQGTAWEHMAYALGVQAVLQGGGNPYDQRLTRAWRLMNDLWDDEAGLWNEPGASGKRATIRAAYFTVCAFEEARMRLGQLSMNEPAEEPGALSSGMDGDTAVIRSVSVDAGLGQVTVCAAEALPVSFPVPGRLPPFPHDAGVSLGAAWAIAPPASPAALESPYLGALLEAGPHIDQARADGLHVEPFVPETVAELLLGGAIGAVAEGRAEAGPRALGHRSIIAIPCPADVRDRINVLKGREPWRPLAPVTVQEYAPRLWPGQGSRALYMVGAASVSAHGQAVMPAATHVDATTRPQVLPSGAAPAVESILRHLQQAGLPPVLVNTSLNGPGEPIADSAAQAIQTLKNLGLDFLILGGHLIRPARR